MIKNFSIIFFTCIVLFTMQSCDNENGWDFEMPGCIDISASTQLDPLFYKKCLNLISHKILS